MQHPDNGFSFAERARSERILQAFIQSVDLKIQQCLKRTGRITRHNSPESRFDISVAMTPSVLSQELLSARNENEVSNEHLSPGTVRGSQISILPLRSNVSASTPATIRPDMREIHESSQVDVSPVNLDEPVAVAGVIRSDTCRPTPVTVHASGPRSAEDGARPTELIPSNEQSQSVESTPVEVQTLHPRLGETLSHSFHVGVDSILRLSIPGLHVSIHNHFLQAGENLSGNSSTAVEPRPLELETQRLSWPDRGGIDEGGQIIDMDDGQWTNKEAPEGILFSPQGLVLKRRDVLLILRARAAA